MPLNLTLSHSAVPDVASASIAPEDLVAWAATVALNDGLRDPLRAGRVVATELEALNRQRVRITLRQDINEALFPLVQRLLALLERHVDSGTVPLSSETRAAAALADSLIARLAASYKLLLVEQGRRLFGFASSGRALLPVQRTVLLATQRLVLSYRVYATVPKGTWTELHELYQFAARRGLSQREVTPGDATAAALYKGALLLAFTDPLRFAAGDLDLVVAIVQRHGNRAEIGVAPERGSNQGAFVIKPQRDIAGYSIAKRSPPSAASTAVAPSLDLILNTLPVAAALLNDLSRLSADGGAEDAGLPAGTDPQHAKDLLGRLVKMWGAAPHRRFSRLRTQARVEISVGVAAIVEFLLDEAAASSGSAWQVTNESEQGFAIKHMTGPIARVRVGEVVGLRARDSRTCHICVVRWVLSDRPDHLELGLEELARQARAIAVRRIRDASGTSVPALLLPEVPERGKGQSILAPLTTLDATCELSIGELQTKLKVRPTQLLERTASVQVVEFSSIS